MFSNKLNYKLINFTVLMLLLYISFSNVEVWINVISTIGSALFPFLVAFAIAYAITPVLNFLMQKGLKKGLSISIIVIAVVLLVISLFLITLPLVYDQLVVLSKSLIEIFSDIGKNFNINLSGFDIKITDYLNSITKNLGGILSEGTINIFSKSISFIGKFVIGFIAWIYFLSDMDHIRIHIKRVSKKISNKFYRYIRCLDLEIGNYIKGLTIFMFIQLIEYSFLFWLVGHPNWLLLGILASVTTIIPYFGGLVTNVIGIIIASVVSMKVLIGTIIICIVFSQVDAYIISPKIYGKTNNVNPLITIMVVSIGGSIGGLVGIIAALPTYLLIRTTYSFYRNDLKKSVKRIKKDI